MDTDLLSLLERKQVPAKLAQWVKANDGEIFLSVVSVAEIQHGANFAPPTHRQSLQAWLAQVRQSFVNAIDPLDETVLVRWKELLAGLKLKNRTMTCEDSLIAATALVHGHVVATHNVRHFSPAGVAVIDPLA